MSQNKVMIVPLELTDNPMFVFFITAFYCHEMKTQLGWNALKRFTHMRSVQSMLISGNSTMHVVVNEQNMPCAMLVYTPTDTKKIVRLEALYVPTKLQNQGLAGKLLESLRYLDCDIHAYATPDSLSWYLKNGFHRRSSHEEGTIEVFTGQYEPNYTYNLKVIQPSKEDLREIKRLEAREKSIGL